MQFPKLKCNKSALFSFLLLLIIQPFNIAVAQEERKISGSVTDTKGAPASSVTVTVKGTKKIYGYQQRWRFQYQCETRRRAGA